MHTIRPDICIALRMIALQEIWRQNQEFLDKWSIEMFKNEKLNKICDAVSKDDPQNKMTTMFLLKLVENLIEARDDGERLRLAHDIINVMSE